MWKEGAQSENDEKAAHSTGRHPHPCFWSTCSWPPPVANVGLTDCDSLRVDGTEVAILKQVDHEVLGGLVCRGGGSGCAQKPGLQHKFPTILCERTDSWTARSHLLQRQQRLGCPAEGLWGHHVADLADLRSKGRE